MRPIPHESRGTTLIEMMIAMAVLLIGLAGFASLLPVIKRHNHFAKRVAVATSLATDFEENVHRWTYIDARLNPASTLNGCNTPDMAACFQAGVVTAGWDLGKATAPNPVPQYADANLGAWQGQGADVEKDTLAPVSGAPQFFRYWTVYAIDPAGTGIPNGKLVQIVVRWKEPGYGMRQITSSTFKLNPAVQIQ